MKWVDVYDPDLNDRLRYVTTDSVEMILPVNGANCYVTLRDRGKQWKVKMSAGRLMELIDE